MTRRPSAAFFDLDGTLLPGRSAEGRFVRRLVTGGGVRRRAVAAAMARALTLPWRGRAAALSRNKLYLRGAAVRRVEAEAGRFVREEIVPVLCPLLMERIRAYRAGGTPVFLVTGTLAPIAHALAEEVGFTDVVATEVEVRGGRYTGEVAGRHPFGEAKVDVTRALAARHGVDPSRADGYANHRTDEAFLSLFARPVAVRPDAGLRVVADARGWGVLDPQPRTARFTRFSISGILKWLKLSGSAPATAVAPAASASSSERSLPRSMRSTASSRRGTH